ncbi:hypothetical protein M406DRAFT_292702 [Cryphonectria parasitica EP155]|uniref:Secreted protein n=1 Tax=Cryphonectria parasitica (strain ATCC 38755 / EP155) TaxID=660469 RepID=A0A9P4XY69_CRYP1|nr:uncharacterized protein M406DRAFT_292702 [Cryphonectria parasitica EP155]KAF3763073.1 hypothetical protein M406DRAFT_292702 [Cryphonectria parasitica EP155]
MVAAMRHTLLPEVLLLAARVVHTQTTGTNDLVDSDIEYGTFQNPSSNVRPRFRYWANDASHNLSRVSEDVRSLARAGAGGLELLGYYLYGDNGVYGGGSDAPLQSDWTIYGFGSSAWKNLLDTVLGTAKDEEILVDLAIGPNQGAGVPAPYGHDGVLWDFASFNVTVPAGTTFSDLLPGWGGAYNAESLVAATTGLIVDSNGTEATLSASSLADVTSQVNSSGHLNLVFNASSSSSGSEFVLFAFYLKPADYWEVKASDLVEAAVPQSPIKDYKQNGSRAVDHFSAAGAQLVIDFWNETLLSGDTTTSILEVGNYLWEDSQEYGSNSSVYWTPQLPDAFQKSRGYAIHKYIPLIVSAGLADTGVAAFPITYVTDETDAGQSHIQDYQQTLTELNAIYLKTLTDWSHSLGVQFSSQVVYNLPMDMLANIPYVDAPECETLGFLHNIDGYRQFSGPANLAGKRIISSEAGAVMYLAYQQTIPELLWDLKRSVVGGVNQFVIHAYPFSGDYGNTTWPAFTAFTYLFSEMHGPKQPAWDFYSEWLDWTARTQYVAQTGVPKVDLVFWSKLTSYGTIETQYAPTDLQDAAGYTYEYLSPDNFKLPEAYVEDGIFAPERQAFKAMIVRANASLTLSGVEYLASYAKQGLPIIFSGGLPSNVSGYHQDGGANVTSMISDLTQLDNVHVVPYDGLSSSLSSLEILPRTATSSNGSWYTYWREDNTTSTQYVFVYNDATGVAPNGAITTGSISFEATGKPFVYDAWTGDVTALSSYQQTETHTTIQLQLTGNQSVIIGFEEEEIEGGLHITSSNLASVVVGPPALASNSSSLAVLSTYNPAPQEIILSDNSSRTVQPMLSQAFQLGNWTLTIESWGPPNDIFDIEGGASKVNTSYYTLDNLVPWSQMSDALANVSGRGYYQTTFSWPPDSSGSDDGSSSSSSSSNATISGAFVDLGATVHTARVRINGQALPPLDPTWARADVGEYLVEGENAVDIIVSTPLGNALRSFWGDLMTSGRHAVEVVADPPSVAEYGLVQDVQIIPYRRDSLA